jgi:hypothetical protein
VDRNESLSVSALLAEPLALPKTPLKPLSESKLKSLALKYGVIPEEHKPYYPHVVAGPEPAPKPAPKRGAGRPPKAAAVQAAPQPAPKPAPKRGPGRPPKAAAGRQPAPKPAPKHVLGRPSQAAAAAASQVAHRQPTLSAFMSAAKRPRLDAAVEDAAIDVELAAEEEESEELGYASDTSEAFLP